MATAPQIILYSRVKKLSDHQRGLRNSTKILPCANSTLLGRFSWSNSKYLLVVSNYTEGSVCSTRGSIADREFAGWLRNYCLLKNFAAWCSHQHAYCDHRKWHSHQTPLHNAVWREWRHTTKLCELRHQMEWVSLHLTTLPPHPQRAAGYLLDSRVDGSQSCTDAWDDLWLLLESKPRSLDLPTPTEVRVSTVHKNYAGRREMPTQFATFLRLWNPATPLCQTRPCVRNVITIHNLVYIGISCYSRPSKCYIFMTMLRD